MNGKILLTSFQTWLPQQTSNSSDDLLEEIAKLDISPSLSFLRQLPVDVSDAASCVISKIEELQPDAIICCGMAAGRNILTVESCATCIDALDYISLCSYFLSIGRIFDFKNLQYLLSLISKEISLQDEILLSTSVDLEKLLAGLVATEISYDAGKFVCEGLYYEILKYLGNGKRNACCIFVHVPVLTPENLPIIVADFHVIIDRMASIY